MERMGRLGRSLGAVVMIGLTVVGCATPRGVTPRSVAAASEPPADALTPADVARRCEEFAKSFRYAEKSVGGRLAASAILAPLAIGIGLAATAFGNVQGLGLAVMGPIELGRWTAKASQDNKEQLGRVRQACAEGGGPDTVAAARAVRDLAQVRERERSTRDAVRLYRDTLVILDRAGAGESEDAASAALSLVSLVEKATPADPEIGVLYDRAIRAREAEGHTRLRDLGYALAQYGRWLRTAGRPGDADAIEARAAVVDSEATAAEERDRAATDAARNGVSTTDIVVGERCVQPSISALDRLNQEATAQGGMARVLAVDCGEAGQISVVRLTTPAGASDALTFDDQEADPAERIRAALFTSEP